MPNHLKRSDYLYLSLIMLVFTQPAYAYLDPGTAGMAFQAVVAAIAGVFIFFRHKILSLFGSVRKLFGKSK